MTRPTLILVVALAPVAALVVVGIVKTHDSPAVYTRSGGGIMGTTYSLSIVAPSGRPAVADRAARVAEEALRDVEVRMSTYIEASELSRLNAAPADERMRLSRETRDLMDFARRMSRRTWGAFDPTARPIIELWKRSGRARELPDDDAVDTARAASGWEHFRFVDGAVVKDNAAAGVDLGGIAKGYAIDRAVEAVRAAGAAGGLVEVGGDLRCFGERPTQGKWTVAVQSPFADDDAIAALALASGAVCTSGNYRRFSEIDGRRYSHIVDPRTGRPVDRAPSVTVVAPTATAADAWATALSVLGPEGLETLADEDGVEAMVIVGGPDDYTWYATPGFEAMLVRAPARGSADHPPAWSGASPDVAEPREETP